MSRRIIPAAWILLAASTVCAAGADKQAAADVEVINKLMSEQIVAVLQIDTARVTAEPLQLPILLGKLVAPKANVPPADAIVGLARRLRQAGLDRMYLLIETASPNRAADLLIVAPGSDNAAAERIEKLLMTMLNSGTARDASSSRDGNYVIARTAPAHVAGGTAAPRPYLPAALATTRGATLAAIWAPTNDQRRVLAELFPLSITQSEALAPGLASLEWATLSWFGDGDTRMRTVFQHQSDSAAAEAVKAVDSWLAQFAMRLPDSPPLNAFKAVLPLLQPRAVGDQIIVELNDRQAATVRTALEPALQVAGTSVDRQQAFQWLKYIGLALINYYSDEKGSDGKPRNRFPDAASKTPQGEPLLSWRVHILPYLEQNELYQQFRLDEPWDSEHNRKLLQQMPDQYKLGSEANNAAGKTSVLLPVGELTAFPNGRGLAFKELSDGASQTILAVEADDEHAVPWTKPEDLQFDPAQAKAGLGRHYGLGFIALMADGSVQFFDDKLDSASVRAMFTRAAQDVVKPPE